MNRLRFLLAFASCAGSAFATFSAQGSFHLWQVKEVFSSADDSVQFVELFDSFSGENFVSGFTLKSNSDGVIKTFTFPANLVGETAGHSLLIATSGFGALAGGVIPTFTFDQGGVVGPFFNSHATNLTFTYNGSNDSMSFAGASLPKDGVHSLTDAGAFGAPPGTPNISSGVNSPTNFTGATGSVNVPPAAPEPTTLALFVAALLGLAATGRHLRRLLR